MKNILVIAALFLINSIFPVAVLAQDYSGYESRILRKIFIEGNSKTKSRIILNEMDVKVGKALTAKDLKESLVRLKNLRVFSKVSFRLKKKGEKSALLKVKVAERWTTIPILKVNDGGGSTQISAGAYDINFLGNFVELGLQYESLNGSPAAVTWFRNPRLGGKRVQIGYDLWFINRNRSIYSNSVPEGEEAKEIAAFTTNKHKANFFIDKEFTKWFTWGVGLDYTNERASEDELSDELKMANSQSGFLIPENIEQYAFYTYFKIGRLNYTNYLVEGFQSDWKFEFSDEGLAGDASSSTITQKTQYFHLFPYEQNIALNFSTGFTDNRVLSKHFFVGGLENVRGFVDGQFIGRNFWQANFEYRISSYRSNWITLQHNIFYDVGNTSDKFDVLFKPGRMAAFQSVGAGLRIISPKIFRLNVRIDVAQSLNYNKALDVSFGLQQFF